MKTEQAWSPMYKSFRQTSLGRRPAFSLELITPDASITGHSYFDTHLIMSADDLATEHALLSADVKAEFQKQGASDKEAEDMAKSDPDVALMQQALNTLA